MTTFVPAFRAGIRGERAIPLAIPGFDAGSHEPARMDPDPTTVPSWRAGLRGPWWKRAVGRGK